MDLSDIDLISFSAHKFFGLKGIGCLIKRENINIITSMLKDSKFVIGKINEFDRTITYNLKPGFKESFGFGVSFKRK